MSPFASFWSYLPVPYANECFSSIGHCIKNLFAGIWFDGLFVYHDDFSFRIILKYLEVCMRRKERTEESEGKKECISGQKSLQNKPGKKKRNSFFNFFSRNHSMPLNRRLKHDYICLLPEFRESTLLLQTKE